MQTTSLPDLDEGSVNTALRLEPQLVRRTSATVIYETLFQAIASMELRPGEALQEKLLTQRFGVSRTPVREALLHLSGNGLVDLFPQSGTFVARISVRAIDEAVAIRRALEEMTVGRVAEVAGPAEITRLDMIIARQQLSAAHKDMSGFHDADEAFHELIALVAGYPTVWRVVRQTKVHLDRLRRLTLPVEGRMEQVIDEHLRIRNAIAENDVAGAKAALQYHLGVLLPDIGRLSDQYPDYFIGRSEGAGISQASTPKPARRRSSRTADKTS